jgi:quercetin dioxygenase-like cupin family protein
MLGMKVTFSPGASTPPHTHAGAFVAVHVLTGSVLNKINDDPMMIKKTGDSFYEAPDTDIGLAIMLRRWRKV